MLAAKVALGCRVDALGEDNSSELGLEHRATLEKRIKMLQERGAKRISGSGKEKFKFESYKVKGYVLEEAEVLDAGNKLCFFLFSSF